MNTVANYKTKKKFGRYSQTLHTYFIFFIAQVENNGRDNNLSNAEKHMVAKESVELFIVVTVEKCYTWNDMKFLLWKERSTEMRTTKKTDFTSNEKPVIGDLLVVPIIEILSKTTCFAWNVHEINSLSLSYLPFQIYTNFSV